MTKLDRVEASLGHGETHSTNLYSLIADDTPIDVFAPSGWVINQQLIITHLHSTWRVTQFLVFLQCTEILAVPTSILFVRMES